MTSVASFFEEESISRESDFEKLFNKAYDYSERFHMEREERLEFLQDVWVCLFRERLRNMNDKDLSNTDVSNKYTRSFDNLCAGKKLLWFSEEKHALQRRLAIEQYAQVGSRGSTQIPFQIIPAEERNFSSLGNLEGVNALFPTQLEIQNKISATRSTSALITSHNRPATTSFYESYLGLEDIFVGKLVATGRRVVVKTSGCGACGDAAIVREAKIQANINHQCVPPVLAFNPSDVPMIVEPFIEGFSWASLLDSQTLEEKMDIFVKVCEIMTYVHRVSKIAHGDLKPQKIMLGNYDEIYIVGWGAAIKLDDAEEDRIIRWHTANYCSPEVCPHKGVYGAHQPATAATDVYMMGNILWQIVVPSHKTFNETLSEASLYEHSCWKNRDVFPKIPDVSNETFEVLKKALSYKPENRYQDAGKLVDALKRL